MGEICRVTLTYLSRKCCSKFEDYDNKFDMNDCVCAVYIIIAVFSLVLATLRWTNWMSSLATQHSVNLETPTVVELSMVWHVKKKWPLQTTTTTTKQRYKKTKQNIPTTKTRRRAWADLGALWASDPPCFNYTFHPNKNSSKIFAELKILETKHVEPQKMIKHVYIYIYIDVSPFPRWHFQVSSRQERIGCCDDSSEDWV